MTTPKTHRRATLQPFRLAACTLLSAAAALAQPASRSTHEARFYDSVAALVGDRAILTSTIDQELGAYLSGERSRFESELLDKQPGGTPPPKEEIERRWQEAMPPEQRDKLWHQLLGARINELRIAESAKTLGNVPPERFKEAVDQYLEEYTNRETEKAGGNVKYNNELSLLGKTWKGVQDETRTRYMTSLALYLGVERRLRDQLTLFVTPKEMLAYYEQNKGEFVQEPSVDVAQIGGFFVEGASNEAVAAARVKADGAAQDWRKPDADLEALKVKYGASVQVMRAVRPIAGDPRASYVKDFARGAELGTVSAPLRVGNGFCILKVIAKNPGRNDSFDDPAVQARILELLKTQKRQEIQRRFTEGQVVPIQDFSRPQLRADSR